MEINPQSNIVPEYPVAAFTPCGPWITSYDEFNPYQVVWNQISFAPDPYQQMFNFQDNRYGPGLQRRTYILDPNKNYNLTIQQSDEYAYFTYGGFYDNSTGVYVPIQYVGTTLSGVLGSDLGATAWLDYARDYPNGLYNNDSKYRIKIKRDVPLGAEITMVVFDGQTTINYHTRIETPTFSIESITDEDILLHYYSREIEFILNFQQSGGNCQLDGYGGAYPVGVKFNVEIVQGQEYGNLYYPGTVADPEQSGTSITNLDDEYGIGVSNYTIKYKADGVQPDSLAPGIVTIRCSANDLDIAPVEVSFPVEYNIDPLDEGGYIIVGLDKQSYEPGDTAITNCKWLTAYNELLDFPAEQSFSVQITGGSEFGMLLDPYTGTVSDNLQGVSNGFKVITATAIPYDSVVIRIKVNTSIEVNNAARMITNQNPKSEIKENKISDNDDGTQTITPDFFIGNPGQEIEGFGEVVVKQDECDEEIVICDSFGPQKVNENAIEILGANQNWQWVDGTGKTFTTNIGEPCIYDESPERGHAMTRALTQIPYFNNAHEPIYNIFEDMRISVCLDKRETGNEKWQFNVDNIRIPIYMSLCPREGWIELGDGTDPSLLSVNIKDCNELGDVTQWLDIYWIPGQHYAQIKPGSTYKYTFSAGTLKNEEYHVNRFKYAIPSAINDSLTLLRTDRYKFLNEIYPCPEDVIAVKTLSVLELILGGRNSWPSKMETSEIEEKRSDDYSRDKFKQIRQNIINWAKQQSWWNDSSPFCQDAISGH